jgi:hypothetical protein
MAINASSKLALLLLIIHSIVVIVVCLTSMPLSVKAIILSLVASSFAYHFARDVFLQLPNSWREIVLVPDGILVTKKDGSKISGQITSKTAVSPYFVVLLVKLEARYFTCARVIFPDAMGKSVFRELCVLLKFSYPD